MDRYRINDTLTATIDGKRRTCRVLFPIDDGRYYVRLYNPVDYAIVDDTQIRMQHRNYNRYKSFKPCELVFFGNGNFALPSLVELYKRGYIIRAVVTVPDKPQGRGLKPTPCVVKEYAVSKGIPVLQPTNLEDREFIEQLRGVDVGVIADYRILPKSLYLLPRYGFINVHSSLLPNYRGATPVARALLNKDTYTGVTTFSLTDEVDCGGIYHNLATRIDAFQDCGQLTAKLARMGASIISASVQLAINKIGVITQKKIESPLLMPSNAPRFDKSFLCTDFNLNANDLVARCRALNPSPSLRANIGGVECKLYDVDTTWVPVGGDYEIGDVIFSRFNVFVATSDYFVRIVTLSPNNSRVMDAKSFINGYGKRVKHDTYIDSSYASEDDLEI